MKRRNCYSQIVVLLAAAVLFVGAAGTGLYRKAKIAHLIVSSTLVPGSDDAVDLGSSSAEFKDGYFDGTVNADTLVATTATVTNLVVAGSEIIGIFTYAADPGATTATLAASGALAGDFILSGAPSGAANGTFKALTGAVPGTDVIALTWEVDPGAVITHTFMVLR